MPASLHLYMHIWWSDPMYNQPHKWSVSHLLVDTQLFWSLLKYGHGEHVGVLNTLTNKNMEKWKQQKEIVTHVHIISLADGYVTHTMWLLSHYKVSRHPQSYCQEERWWQQQASITSKKHINKTITFCVDVIYER